jgi:hypothetical protein
MRFEVLTAVLVFRFVTQRGLVGTNVSEEHNTFIFRSHGVTTQKTDIEVGVTH